MLQHACHRCTQASPSASTVVHPAGVWLRRLQPPLVAVQLEQLRKTRELVEEEEESGIVRGGGGRGVHQDDGQGQRWRWPREEGDGRIPPKIALSLKQKQDGSMILSR